METKIELDESKALEAQTNSLQLVKKAEIVVVALEAARVARQFDHEAEELLQEAEFHGKELARFLDWWKGSFMGPLVTSAHQLHKMLCNRQSAIADPVENQKRRTALAVGSYRAAHEADRLEREDKERKRLEKEAEDQRLSEAAELEKSGRKEEANDLIEQPVYTPPVTYAAPEKTRGVGVRGNWKFEVTNPKLVPAQFWIIDEAALGGQVRLNKDKTPIPGVRIWFEPSASFSAR